jgi:hypothetical protein
VQVHQATGLVVGSFFHLKGLSFISKRRKKGTFCASELAGMEPTPARSGRAGYVRLNLLATGGHCSFYIQFRIYYYYCDKKISLKMCSPEQLVCGNKRLCGCNSPAACTLPAPHMTQVAGGAVGMCVLPGKLIDFEYLC